MSTEFHHNIYLRANPALHRAILSRGQSGIPFLLNLQLYWLAPREVALPGLRIEEFQVRDLLRLALDNHAESPEEQRALRRILEIGVKEFHPGAILE